MCEMAVVQEERGNLCSFPKMLDSVVIRTLLRSELHGFVDATGGTGFSWGSLVVLIACNCDRGCGPRVEKVSVGDTGGGTGIAKVFVPLFFIGILQTKLCVQ